MEDCTLMKLTSKFGLGQEVWYLTKEYPKKWIPCSFCGEAGRISGFDGEEINCPVCHGRKGKSERQKPKNWTIQGSGHVTQIQAFTGGADISVTYILDEPNAVEYWGECPACGYDGDYNVLVFDEAELFGSDSDAQEACDERSKR